MLGLWICAIIYSWLCLDDLQEAMRMAREEFSESLVVLSPEGLPLSRNTSWTGLRFMISEVSRT